MRSIRCSMLLATTCCLAIGCGAQPSRLPSSGQQSDSTSSTEEATTMQLTSPVLTNNGTIDPRYTEDGDDLSPPLQWSGAPEGTVSFALICDDPDAPSPRRPAPKPWVHWVIFNIPAEQTSLPEGIQRTGEPAEVPGARQGINSWPSDNLGYRGPAPPPGSGPHRYVFRLYALDTMLDLPPGASKEEVLEAMSGHVLAEGKLIGVYER